MAVCAGFRVSGKAPPTVVKSVPETEAEVTMTGVVRVDFSVSTNVVVVLTGTLLKLRLVVLTVNCESATVPAPLKATITVLPLEELLLIAS